jgi:DNA replication protein DnaC
MEKHIKYQEIVDKAKTIPKVQELIQTYQMNDDILFKAIPILMDMIDEFEADYANKYETSFVVLKNNSIKKIDILSAEHSKMNFTKNFILTQITKPNFKISFEVIDRSKDRETIGLAIAKYFKSIKEEAHGKSLYIYGAPGIGKTFISQAIANKIASLGHKVVFINTVDLVAFLKNNFQTGIDKFLQELKVVDYLFLDDVGSETVSE